MSRPGQRQSLLKFPPFVKPWMFRLLGFFLLCIGLLRLSETWLFDAKFWVARINAPLDEDLDQDRKHFDTTVKTEVRDQRIT